MNIHIVAQNLRDTIAGKEQALKEYNKALNVQIDPLEVGERMAINATVEFLEINIAELKRILRDVETCCEKATEASWAGQVDRQGGAFDESELRGRDGWM